jgi:hypothetical protein
LNTRPIVCGVIFRLGRSGVSWRRRVDRKRRAFAFPLGELLVTLPRIPDRVISASNSTISAS